MKRSKKKTLNNMAVFVLVIMVMFMSIVSIEVITVLLAGKIDLGSLPVEVPETTTKVESPEVITTIDLSGVSFEDVEVNNKVMLRNKCSKGCNLKINNYDINYYYMIKYENDNYYLTVAKDDKIVYQTKNLGTDISKSYLDKYIGYVLFYNINKETDYNYDFAMVIDNTGASDEFTSVSTRELTFGDEGVEYTYDECKAQDQTNAIIVTARRMPFSTNITEVETKNTNVDWCITE